MVCSCVLWSRLPSRVRYSNNTASQRRLTRSIACIWKQEGKERGYGKRVVPDSRVSPEDRLHVLVPFLVRVQDQAEAVRNEESDAHLFISRTWHRRSLFLLLV